MLAAITGCAAKVPLAQLPTEFEEVQWVSYCGHWHNSHGRQVAVV